MKNLRIVRRNLKICYKFVCAIVVTFMIGYWFYKYEIEDRDIGVVDFVPIEEATGLDLPVASLCFKHPVLEEKLMKTNPNVTKESYLECLEGRSYNVPLENINYHNVTLNLTDYFLYADDLWRNESFFSNSSLSIEHEESFNGLYRKRLMKCFSLRFSFENNRYIKSIRFHYDLQKLLLAWYPELTWRDVKIYFKIHYPNQFLLGETPAYFKMHKRSEWRTIEILELELLKRRNTRKKKCLTDTFIFDSLVLEKHLSQMECRISYLKTKKNVPLCNTSDKMRIGAFEYENSKSVNIPKACRRITKMKLDMDEYGKNWIEDSKIWKFRIDYPEEVKIITQSKEVDIHGLIGNVGGYLGLFLGKLQKIR